MSVGKGGGVQEGAVKYRKRRSGLQKKKEWRRGVQEMEDWSTGKEGVKYRKRRSGLQEKSSGVQEREVRSKCHGREEYRRGMRDCKRGWERAVQYRKGRRDTGEG